MRSSRPARGPDGGSTGRREHARPPARATRGETKRRGTRTPAPGPVEARGVLVHVADGGTGDDGAARRERPHQRAVAGVADDHIAARASCASRRPSRQPVRCRAPAVDGAAGGGSRWRAPARAHRRGPAARRAAAAARGPARSTARRGPGGSSPGGGSTSSAGGSHMSGPDDVHVRGPCARVLELGERRDDRQLAADAPVEVVERLAGRAARACSFSSSRPRSSPRWQPGPGRAATGPTERGARQARAERVDREARLARADRRAGSGSRAARRSSSAARAGASVRMSATTTSGRSSPHERQRVHRGAGRRPRRSPVARGREGKTSYSGAGAKLRPSASTSPSPALPGLERDVVPAGGQRRPEGDHREGVAGVAEGAQQDPRRSRRGQAAARRPVAAARGARRGRRRSG